MRRYILIIAAIGGCATTNRLSHIDRNGSSDADWRLVSSAPRRGAPPRPTPPPPAPPRSRRKSGPKAVVAVFDIRDKGAELSADSLSRMSDYLAAKLAAEGHFQIVPRDQLLQRLRQEKGKSYKQCFDQSCQIEIGKEMAAQKSLSTDIVRIGSRCNITSVLYDLRTAASEGGASARSACTEDGIATAIDEVAQRLSR